MTLSEEKHYFARAQDESYARITGPYIGGSINILALLGSLLEVEYRLLNEARNNFNIRLDTILL